MEKEKPDADKDEDLEDEGATLEAMQVESAEGTSSKRKIKRLDVEIMDHVAIEKWEMETQEKLQKLAWLLRRLRDMVMEETDGSAVMVSLGKGEPLTVYGMQQKVGALPQEIIDVFWDL